MQTEKADLAVILCILNIAVVDNSNRDSRIKKLKPTEIKKHF